MWSHFIAFNELILIIYSLIKYMNVKTDLSYWIIISIINTCENFSQLIWENFSWKFLIINLIRFSWVCENFSYFLFMRWEKFFQIWNKENFFIKFSQSHKCEIKNNFLWENFHFMATLKTNDQTKNVNAIMKQYL